jgi:NCS1 family nucleobase:cation symporter-1
MKAVVPQLDPTLQDSPLYSPAIAPVPPSERTWKALDFAALWIGMCVVLTTYTLAGGLMSASMTPSQALLTITLGNLVVLVPMLLMGFIGARHGIPFPVLARATFGLSGANVAAMTRALVGCGWFGIQTWLGGLAISTIAARIWPAWTVLPGHDFIAFALCWVIQMAIIMRGMTAVQRFERFAAPLLLVVSACLLWWAVKQSHGFSGLWHSTLSLQHHTNPDGSDRFAVLFWPGLAANVGYWATLSLNIPDFTRYARSQGAHMLGQGLALPLTMAGFSAIGIAVTAASLMLFKEPMWNPVELIPRITHSAPLLVLAMVAILLAQFTTNIAANVVAPANDFINLAPRRISFGLGALLTGLIGIAMFPWLLLEHAGAYVFTWLGGYGSLLGAFCGVMLCDYFLIRRMRLDVWPLYRPDGHARWVWTALAAVVLAVTPVIPGFIRAATVPGGIVEHGILWDRLYTYGWFFTFLAGVCWHVLLGLPTMLAKTMRHGQKDSGNQ